jgi:hypothetical protein
MLPRRQAPPAIPVVQWFPYAPPVRGRGDNGSTARPWGQ